MKHKKKNNKKKNCINLQLVELLNNWIVKNYKYHPRLKP